MGALTLSLRVRQVTYQAIGMNSYELTREDGGELPPFSPGAHIDVHTEQGHVRQFSLCNDPDERHRYVIAVLRQENGSGGSIAIHASLFPPHRVTVGTPRNNFRLVEGAARYILVAGGIGVTPLKSMVHRLERSGAVDHRDLVLSDEERGECHAAGVSRGTSGILDLGL